MKHSCPWCLVADELPADRSTDPGDTLFCNHCLGVVVVTDQLTLRQATEGETHQPAVLVTLNRLAMDRGL